MTLIELTGKAYRRYLQTLPISQKLERAPNLVTLQDYEREAWLTAVRSVIRDLATELLEKAGDGK